MSEPLTVSLPADVDGVPTNQGSRLSGRFHSGLRLSLMNTAFSRAATFASGVLLARLIAPEQFGLYAAALVVQTLLLTFNDFGTATALVRHDGDVRPLLPTVWTISISGGALVYLGCLFTAPVLADGLGSPQATGLIRLLCLNVLFDGFAAVPGALLTRELRQGLRLIADLSGLIVNLALTVGLALLGAGAVALVVGHICGTATVTVALFIVTKELPKFGLNKAHIHEVIKYGGAVVASSIVMVLLQYAPQTITGHLLGATALGFLYLAANVANWPASVISTTVERIGLATFSRARDAGVSLNRAAGGVIQMVAMATLPTGAALAMLAPHIIQVVYGSPWLPAASVLSGLAVATVAKVLADLVFNLMITAGATVSSVLIQVIWLIVLVPVAVVATLQWQLDGMGWSVALVAIVVALPVHAWGLRTTGIHVPALIRGLGVPLLFTAVTIGLLCVVGVLLPSPLPALLVGVTVTAFIVSLGLLRGRKALSNALDDPVGSVS